MEKAFYVQLLVIFTNHNLQINNLSSAISISIRIFQQVNHYLFIYFYYYTNHFSAVDRTLKTN